MDDSPFELQQVRAVLPEVRVLNAEEYKNLLSRPEFDVPVTKESTSRRKLYQVENARQEIKQSFGEDYKAFLKHCDIRMTLSAMTDQSLQRVHELTQRMNEMNFSGKKYDRSRLAEILQSPDLDTYVIQCEDRFGSYGVVGFAVVDKREPRLTDLMFSCRIRAKRVEHAFLAYVIDKYTSQPERNSMRTTGKLRAMNLRGESSLTWVSVNPACSTKFHFSLLREMKFHQTTVLSVS